MGLSNGNGQQRADNFGESFSDSMGNTVSSGVLPGGCLTIRGMNNPAANGYGLFRGDT
jgi:hypothetical protein